MKYFALILAVSLALSSCGGHRPEHDHEHNHEAQLMLTAYNDSYEIFIEASPMVTGETGELMVHVTKLSDFKPLTDASVSVELNSCQSSVEAEPEHSHVPGIYHFDLTPVSSGPGSLKVTVTTEGNSEVIEINDIEVFDDEHQAHHEAEEAHIHSGNAVSFSKEMSWNVDFSTEEVARRPAGRIIRTVAQVQPSNTDTRTITAPAAGVLTYAMSDLTDGSAVRRGVPVFRIDGSGQLDNNLSVRIAEARSNYETARAEYERISSLSESQLVTRSQLNESRNRYETARAAFENLRAQTSGGDVTVSSSIDGYVISLDAANGSFVETGQPLAVVARNRDIYLKAEVQPSLLPELAHISDVNIRSVSGGDARSLNDLNGRVVSYGRSVDASNPLVPVTFRVDNSGGMIPGTFVEMFITCNDGTTALSVPAGAIIEEMGNKFVYVQLTPEYFEKREVTTGTTDGRYTRILSGLSAGERVVSRGAMLVKLAHSSGALDPHAGHVH